MTEPSPVSTQTRVDDSIDRRVSTVGRVGPHLEVKIIDPETGLTMPYGEPGELCTRGYSVMLGYWEEPDKTAEAIDAARWMHTGDLAVMDAEGYVNITGRIKDMVIRGGENIYPREVEELLYTHPDVLDAQVIGVPDVKYGEGRLVWVRMRDGAQPVDADAVRAFCAGKVARFKIPRYVHVVDEFPMTVTGKIRKVEMREKSVSLLGLEDAARAQHAQPAEVDAGTHHDHDQNQHPEQASAQAGAEWPLAPGFPVHSPAQAEHTSVMPGHRQLCARPGPKISRKARGRQCP